MNNAQELIYHLAKTLHHVEITTEEVTLFTSVTLYATVHHDGRSWEKSAQEWYATDLEAFREAEGIPRDPWRAHSRAWALATGTLSRDPFIRKSVPLRERRFNVVGVSQDFVDADESNSVQFGDLESEVDYVQYAKEDAALTWEFIRKIDPVKERQVSFDMGVGESQSAKTVWEDGKLVHYYCGGGFKPRELARMPYPPRDGGKLRSMFPSLHHIAAVHDEVILPKVDYSSVELRVAASLGLFQEAEYFEREIQSALGIPEGIFKDKPSFPQVTLDVDVYGDKDPEDG